MGDGDNTPQAIIKTTNVELVAFSEISKKQAQADLGSMEKSLEDWRKVHEEFFSKLLENDTLSFTEDMKVIYSEFEVVWK